MDASIDRLTNRQQQSGWGWLSRFCVAALMAMMLGACSSSGSDSDSGDNDDNDDDTEETANSPTVAGDILISEIMANPDFIADVLGEWIELYNPGTEKLDLQGCVVSDNTGGNFVINRKLRVLAGRYRTFAISATPGFVPDASYNGSGFTLNNTADIVTLTCNGVVIDARNYTSTASGRSSSLSNNGNGLWCNDLVNFYNGTDSGTPGATNINC